MRNKLQQIRFFDGRQVLALIGFGLLLCAILVSVIPAEPARALTASTMNFQARLMDDNGSIAPDGNYNIEFKLYDTASSGGTVQGICTGNCVWMETRTGGSTVTVANGYVTVNLGSVTSFASTINWDQDLWLTMNVGGTGTPSWDGEMTPRLKLTAVPYAFRAGQLSRLAGSYTGTLEFASSFAQNSLITLPDPGAATATVCYQNSASCGFATGSAGSYIQNGTSVQTAANFNIRSNAVGSVTGVLQGANGQTADLFDVQTWNGSIATTVFGVSNVGDLTVQSVNVAANKNIVLASGTGTYSQTYSNNTGVAATFNVTDNATSGTTAVQGVAINLTGTNNAGGTNSISGLAFGNIAAATNNAFHGIDFGTGFTDLLRYNGTPLISGTGIVQSAAISGSYTGITGVGTLTVGALGTGFTTVDVAQGGTGAVSLTTNGVLYGNGTSAIAATAAGTTGQCLVGNTSAAPSWSTCLASVSLQTAYTGGNTISTSGNPIGFTLNGSDNFTVTTAAGGTGSSTFSLADGGNASPAAQLVLINNEDIDQVLANGLTISSAAGGITDGLDVSDAELLNAINVGDNVILGAAAGIDFTNFDVTGAGALTAVGVNSGAGLLQGAGGLTVAGAVSINTTGTANTSIGNATGTFEINSNAFDVSTAGALSGITTIATSSTINAQTISSTANFTGTVTVQGANALTLGVTGTSTGAILFNGATGSSGTLTLIGPTNPTTNTLTLPNETGTLCVQTSTSCGFAPTTGSTNYIQNQTATPQSANFYIQSASSSAIGAVIQAATSQTADLFQFKGANGELFSKLDANGALTTYGATNTFAGITTPAFTTGSTGTSFYYVITATNAQGETVASTSLGMTNNTSALAWTQVTGATGYKIYRNTTNVFTSGSLLRTTITNGTTVGFTDTGAATSAGLPPTNPAGSKLLIQSWASQGNNAALEVRDSLGVANFKVGGNGNVDAGGAGNNARLNVKAGGDTFPAAIFKGVSGQVADIFRIQDTGGDTQAAFDGSGAQLTLGRITTSGLGTVTQGKLVFSDGSRNGFGVTLQSLALSGASKIIYLPNENGTVCTTGSICTGYAAAPASGTFIKQVPTSTLENTITPTTNSVVGLTVNATSGTAATAAIVNQSQGADALNVNVTNTTGTAANGIAIAKTGAGTLTSGLSFSGTIGTDITRDTGTLTLQGAAGVTITAAASGTINIGTNAVTGKIVNIGTVGTGANATTLHIADTSDATGAQAVTIGSTAANTGNITVIQGGSNTTQSIQLLPNTAGGIMIGATAGTGTITLGQSTASNTINIGSANITTGTPTQTTNIANGTLTSGAVLAVNILSGGAGTAGTATLSLANNDRVTQVDIGNIAPDANRTFNLFGGNSAFVDTINIGAGNGTVAGAKTINIGTGAPTGLGSNVITIGSTALGSRTELQSGTTGTLTVNTGGTVRATFDNSNTLYLGNGVTNATPNDFIIQGAGSSTGATAGGALTVSGGAGGSAATGGAVTVQGGAAGGGNVNGANVTISGGAGAGTGVLGLVRLAPTTFVSSGTAQSFGVNGSVTGVDSYGSIAINATAASLNITIPVPNALNQVVGRILYVTAVAGSNDFTIVLGGTAIEISMKQNSTATLIWNGTGWTAAGASSSTDLQSAYDNTQASAGAAELVLNASGGAADGLTIRNNGTTPIVGGLLEVQNSIGSNLFSVNNNATEYATNGGAETAGGSVSTFPANTWDTTTGGTVDRYNSLTGGFEAKNLATGQNSVRVQTTTTNHGARNRISASLTSGLTYSVSFAVRGAVNFSTLQVLYSPDGTTTGTTQCAITQTATSGIWSRINCSFAAIGTITSSNSILIRQTDATARTFYVDNLSLTISASATYAADGSVDDTGAFATNWTNYAASGTSVMGQESTVIYDTSSSARAVISATAGNGMRNNLAITPQINTQYLVTFYMRSTTAMTGTVRVGFLPTGGTSAPAGDAACTDYSTQTLVANTWTEINCLFTTAATTITNADLVIYQSDAAARTIYVDALSITLNTNNSNNVQVGGANKGGPATLFTLDRSNGAPIAANNEAYLGSMYYDTVSGRIQCYEADGWGACGAAPDNIVNLNPEYAGAVLNGSGIGTMTADFCANQSSVLQINYVASTDPCFTTGDVKNYYKWTSPQATEQTYSIYVTYQLPATFNGFSSDDTVQLTGRVTDTTNAAVTYQMYYKTPAGSLTQCWNTVTAETAVTTSNNAWQSVGINGNEATGCSLNAAAANGFIIFKINMKAKSNANAFVSTLSFTTTGR